jgi:RimJ/RimL family protein N-acetyltransferase
MYIYENIGFRPIDFEDLEVLRRLHNDMSTLLQLGSVEMASSEQQVDWWKSLGKSKSVQRYSIVKISSGQIIGIFRIQNIDYMNKNCEIGLDIIPSLRGRGYGKKSYHMVLEYLFMHFNMHMVYLRVGEFNERGQALYRRIGFTETGRYKQYLFRNGRYWDYIIYTMLRDDYLKLTKK